MLAQFAVVACQRDGTTVLAENGPGWSHQDGRRHAVGRLTGSSQNLIVEGRPTVNDPNPPTAALNPPPDDHHADNRLTVVP